MGLGSSIAKFVLMNLTGPFLAKVGEGAGRAVGNVIAKRIDPNHESEDDDDEEDGDPEEGDSDDGDEGGDEGPPEDKPA